jgi:hypothetical protein
MSENRTVLAEIKPRVTALVDELVAKGADRLSVVYVIEKEAAALRLRPGPSDRLPIDAAPITQKQPQSAR